MNAAAAPGPRVQPQCNLASVRRRAWAQSRDSLWQDSEQEHCDAQDPQQSPGDKDTQAPSGEPGPNKITSWLIECRTPLGASLDDQSASPSRGAQRNGCSFEDDLSLGAEANHLHNTNNKTEACFGLVAEQKRSQFKEKGRSMNSTGSGKSSTVSSVSELLDLYEEDPEEILLNLGFGREEPDLASKVPSRFFNSSSSARGIDIKVYLGAQMQRMELENPNYALTSRFRQIEVLTTVANEFFHLYNQVSGQSVPCIGTTDQEGEGGEGAAAESSPSLKRKNSARNMAKLLIRKLSKNNLTASSESSESADTHRAGQHNQHGPSDLLKDGCSLATVTEETNGDGEPDRLKDDSPEQREAANGHQTAAAGLQTMNQSNVERNEVLREEGDKNIMTVEKPPPALAPPKLAQLCMENADSFDIEEIQSNEDEVPPSRGNDLSRTVSQQSDSSGFAEEPSADSSSNLKGQVSSDSCDSETTVTSHPSQDVTTPVPTDQPVFDLPDAAVADGRRSSMEEHKHDGSSEEVLQYSAHQLPKRPVEAELNEALLEERVESEDRTISQSEAEPKSSHSVCASDEKLQHVQTPTEPAPPAEEVDAEGDSALLCPPPSASPVLCALNRAKQIQMSRAGQGVGGPLPDEAAKSLERGRGRRRAPMQRSSSLPSSLLSPSRVVSSVRIQFGRGRAACTLPRYSFKYTQEDEGGCDEEEKEEQQQQQQQQEDEEQEGQTNCQSTLFINPASSSKFSRTPARIPTEAPVPPKPIPPYLLHSSCSSQSSSPPHDWSPGGRGHPWSTQSVPDLCFSQHQPGDSKQVLLSSYPDPNSQYVNLSPNPSPGFSSSPNPFALHPPPQYHSRLQPYGSLPNLHNPLRPNMNHHSSLTSLHQPTAPSVPQPGSAASPYHHHIHVRSGSPHPGSPLLHHQGYSFPYSHQMPHHTPPHASPYASPYLGYHGYSVYPHPAYPPLVPEHGLHPGLTPPAPGFFLGHDHSLQPGLMPPAAPGPGSNQGLSSTEMQLRRVLHDIRGTVHSLSQNRADTPDGFTERRTPCSSQQSLVEFQQKRRSLNLFRNQMMDLELSIIRQQAQVYRHLSPADRLEVEQLHSLRSAVREELQELEQQLEDRLMELTHHGGLHRDSSVDSLSTVSALRAMEPMSDLLREQLYLQSELSYDGRAPSTGASSRSASPTRGDSGDDEQRRGVYRASVSITPAPPPRPNTHTVEVEDEGGRDTGGGGGEPGGGGCREAAEEKGAAEGVRLDSLQQLIREIRESVAREVRQEIYSELLSAVSPRQSPLPARQQPL